MPGTRKGFQKRLRAAVAVAILLAGGLSVAAYGWPGLLESDSGGRAGKTAPPPQISAPVSSPASPSLSPAETPSPSPTPSPTPKVPSPSAKAVPTRSPSSTPKTQEPLLPGSFAFTCSALYQMGDIPYPDFSNCTVSAASAFDAVITLGCPGLPGGMFCRYASLTNQAGTQGLNPFSGQPPSVQPAPGTSLQLRVQLWGSWPLAGTYPFQATATSGGTTRSVPLTAKLPSEPTTLGMTCPTVVTVGAGQQGQITCTLTSVNGLNATLRLSCGQTSSTWVTCLDTPEVQVTPGASFRVQVTVVVPATVKPGQYALFIVPRPFVPGFANSAVYVNVPAS